jgi:UDP-glucose:(heptosyl)LPS alpha-1,3-glucosyltransferase
VKIALSFPGCHGRGGVERLLLESANFLAKRGHEVHVLTHDFDARLLDQNVIHHSVPMLKRPSLLRMMSYARNAPSLLRDIGAEISGTFGVICPAGGVLNVQSVHAAWLEASRKIRDFQGRFRQACNPVHPFILTLERRHFAERRYQKLIVPTEQVGADLARFYGVRRADILTIPNGFNNRTLNARRSETLRPTLRKRFALKANDFVVVFVGNELERKGFGPLLRAVALLRNPRIHILAVVGRVSYAHYQDEARRLGMGHNVHFTGAQNDLAPFYAAGDVFALPTQYEAWGLVIVEALACGTPVLTSRLAGAASTVKEGVTGALLDNPLDIREIAEKLNAIAHPSRRRDRQFISDSVAHLTWDCTLKQYESVLRLCRD